MSAPGAQLAAWLTLAAIDAVFIALRIPRPAGGALIRLQHHLFDAGQLVAAGMLASGVCAAWLRYGPRGRAYAYVAFSLLAVGLGRVLLADDLSGVAERLATGDRIEPWVTILTSATALLVPAAAFVGAWLARLRARALVGAGGIGLAIANHFLLLRSYPGLHLYAAWTATILLGVALTGVRLGRRRPGLARLAPAGTVLAALACLGGASALVIRPSSSVLVELLSVPGAPFVPFVARLQQWTRASRPTDRPDDWFRSRQDAPAIAPSRPPLLPPNPIVILLNVDCMRADLLADDSYAAELPTLTKLRHEAVDFTEVRTTAPATTVSLAALFAGRYYSQLYWTRSKIYSFRASILPAADPSPRFTDLLTDAGVDTVTYTGTLGLGAKAGVLGRFREHEHIEGGEAPGEDKDSYAYASELAPRVIERLGKVGDRPTFLFMQFLDPHGPYERPGVGGTDFERYVQVIGLVDAEIGRIVEAIERLGLADRTALFVSADHGEAFGEHKNRYHGLTVYEEEIRVPLLVRLPGVRPRLVAEPASLLDLAPTILDLFGRPTPGSFMGQSLVPLLRGEQVTLSRPLVVDSGRLQQAMIFRDRLKLIRDKRKGLVELYDLAADPGERHNLSDERPEQTRERLAQLEAFFAVHEFRRAGYETPYRPP